MAVPDRRTLLVLASLVVAMTLASGVLLMLEPRPLAPGNPIVLTSLDTQTKPETVLFDTQTPADSHGWTSIVIQQSGTSEGSAATLGKLHERIGLGGLGYHFVVGNGKGSPDGQIEAGFRWNRQLRGAFSFGVGGEAANRRAIGVCLVGDGRREAPTAEQVRELVWLVRQLQTKFNIPADRVVLQTKSDQPGGVSKLFPVAGFRQQLLTFATAP